MLFYYPTLKKYKYLTCKWNNVKYSLILWGFVILKIFLVNLKSSIGVVRAINTKYLLDFLLLYFCLLFAILSIKPEKSSNKIFRLNKGNLQIEHLLKVYKSYYIKTLKLKSVCLCFYRLKIKLAYTETIS